MPLGRGLESLIPDRKPDDNGSDDFGRAQNDQQAPPSLAPSSQGGDTEEVRSPVARTYEDHFAQRRGDSIFWIEVEKVDANPFQPRREFADQALKDLSESIRAHGVLQPILVSKLEIETPAGLEVRYQLIAGERRWRASRLAGLSQIPAIIRRGVPDDRIKLELALIENVQREDLNVIERALAYKQLVDEFHLVQHEIGQRIGKSRELVANTMRLLSLPEEIRSSLGNGAITEGHARAILMVGDDQTRQFEVFHAVLGDRLTVRETENRARQVAGKTLTPRTKVAKVQDPEMRALQSKLQERLGTKVELQRTGEKGKIVVEFYSEEELRSILHKMMQDRGETVQPTTPAPLSEEPMQSREFSV